LRAAAASIAPARLMVSALEASIAAALFPYSLEAA
jgi:hypothetical protein